MLFYKSFYCVTTKKFNPIRKLKELICLEYPEAEICKTE